MSEALPHPKLLLILLPRKTKLPVALTKMVTIFFESLPLFFKEKMTLLRLR
jgi:hypothetical protein